jgi:hypothetical protein
VNDAEWMLLSAVYHHVLAQSPSPEAAKIAISTARKSGRLRMRATVHEHKARPDLRLTGERPPQIPPVITPDHPVCQTDIFDHWDWERSEASRRDSETKSLFWYHPIEVNAKDAIACWSKKTVIESTATPAAIKPAWPGPKATKPKTIRGKKIQNKQWLVMKVLAAMETEGIDTNVPKPALQELVAQRMWKGATCSPSTLYKAEKAREGYKAKKARRRK